MERKRNGYVVVVKKVVGLLMFLFVGVFCSKNEAEVA